MGLPRLEYIIHAVLSHLSSYLLTSCRRMSFRILRATRKIAAGDALGETNFHEDFKVAYSNRGS